MNDFLVIGTGSIGRRHIQCLKDLGVFNIYIADVSEANRQLTQKLFDIKQSFANVDEALEKHYDGVIVAVPNHLHAAVACKVIRKKLNLIIEKPVETNLESAKRIQEAVKQNGVICLVAYCLRFDPGMQKVFEVLQSSRLGQVYSVDISAGRYLPDWRPGVDYKSVYSASKSQGGGVCLDLSHEFDYFRWLFGEAKDVVSVVRKTSDLEIDVEDIAECIITLEKGVIARIHLDYLSRSPRRYLYINGQDGTLEYNLASNQLKLFFPHDNLRQYKQFSTERNVMYRNQLQHFFDCVEQVKQPLITADDAVKTLELALRVRSSLRL